MKLTDFKPSDKFRRADWNDPAMRDLFWRFCDHNGGDNLVIVFGDTTKPCHVTYDDLNYDGWETFASIEERVEKFMNDNSKLRQSLNESNSQLARAIQDNKRLAFELSRALGTSKVETSKVENEQK